MSLYTKQLVVLFVALMLVACAIKAPRTNLNKSHKGRVLGIELGTIQGLLVTKGTKVTIKILSVDGKDARNSWSHPREIELQPGYHTLKVECYGSHTPGRFNTTQTIEIEIESGKEYALKPQYPDPTSCTVTVEPNELGTENKQKFEYDPSFFP